MMTQHAGAVDALELTLLLNDLLHAFAGLDSMPGRRRGPVLGLACRAAVDGGGFVDIEVPLDLARRIAMGALGATGESMAEEVMNEFCLLAAVHLAGWLRSAPQGAAAGQGVEALLEIEGLPMRVSLCTPAAEAAA